MWGSVLVLALLAAFNPVRLAIVLLLISRPRPVKNLLAYWAGSLTGCVWAVLVPLTVLHATPMFESVADHLATSSTVQHIRIGMGVFALLIGVVMTVQSLTRRRQRAHLATPTADTSTVALAPKKPTAISRLLGTAHDGPKEDVSEEGKSAVRRLLGRVLKVWENGSLWVSLVIGFLMAAPEPDVLVFLLAVVVASGAPVGTQVGAAILFAVVMLVLIEIILVSYLVTPSKTQAKVHQLHDWSLNHRRKIVITACWVGGVALVANGVASL